MDSQFWLSSWQEGGFKTSFHKRTTHPYVTKYLTPAVLADKRVFVPLCGKSLDMLYFAEHCEHVTGVELSEIAIRQFDEENGLNMRRTGRVWQYENITILCADFFGIQPEVTGGSTWSTTGPR